jgi:hypothetical protein
MDHAAQPQAIGQIVDLGKVKLITGDVLRPLSADHKASIRGHLTYKALLASGWYQQPYQQPALLLILAAGRRSRPSTRAC